MKANKFFAIALSALTLVGFASCGEKEKEPDLTIDKVQATLKVGETVELVATVTAEWNSSDIQVATVAGNGLKATVTAVAEGNAIITATTKGGQTRTCVILVQKTGGEETKNELKGSQVWPIILDSVTLGANESKIVASFQPNNVDQFLYVWEETYTGNNNPTGLNFYGNQAGFTALTVAKGWAGCGFCLTASGNGWENAKALKDAIVASPDDYFLHMAIKSSDNASHCFYFMGSEATKFIIGTNKIYDCENLLGDFTRDGSWAEFDIPMSAYASVLANTNVEAGVNVFVALTEGIVGAQLNLDAVYFYKK